MRQALSAARVFLPGWSKSPARFAFFVLAVHVLMVLPILAHHGFDPSAFIVAGDRFVDAAKTPAPLIVRPHSDGYDGQFYYRLALAPFTAEPAAFGITLDHPAWRMQRILLPLLVNAATFGRPAAMAWAFPAINLAGVLAIAAFAASLARRLNLPASVPIAIAFWPAWLIALTHDTTEILAASLLMAALWAFSMRRMAAYAVLVALATLARETAILVAIGIALAQAWHTLRAPTPRGWKQVLLAAAAIAPFLIWREAVAALWHSAPQDHGLAHNAGWPFLGWAETAAANVMNRSIGEAAHPRTLIMRLTVLSSLALITAFSAYTVRASLKSLRDPTVAPQATAWLLVFALMSLLTANGPLVEPTAFFRAFSECWIVGWLVLGAAGDVWRIPSVATAVALCLVLRNWQLCWVQLY
jgi:hypothetical protein